IDLADRSALISLVQEEAKRIPDIRQDRVEQIRAALQSRNYHISSDLLADKIIQEILLDEPSTQD
ncbi:MAG: flagellar biosynthesis anti-sigma factor FlgM, partial [Nitrospirales bacterium]|nr:flagellar biosynthesis anti-sigma factor FlgM [Nitrospirales bacterium]